MSYRYFFSTLVLSLGMAVAIHAGELLYANPFASADDLQDPAGVAAVENNTLILDFENTARGMQGARLELDPSLVEGRVVRMSCQVRAKGIKDDNSASPYHGAKVQLVVTKDGVEQKKQTSWFDLMLPAGDYDWRTVSRTVAIPRGLSSAVINMGFQQSSGRLEVRNLKIESVGESVDVASVGNMGFLDSVAGDGQGGWTDQGAEQDGRHFVSKLNARSFGGIPMAVDNAEKGILVMNHEKLPSGPDAVDIAVNGVEAKNLFIMHAVAWAPLMESRAHDVIGTVILSDDEGRSQQFQIRLNQDVGEWFYAVSDKPNGYTAVMTKMPTGENAGLYISKFKISPDLGKIVNIQFATSKSAMWLILGATLTERDIPLPSRQPNTIKAGTEWLPITGSVQADVESGSALDLRGWFPRHVVGDMGRVIVNEKGHFAFEDEPGRDVRFLICTLSPRNGEGDFESHASIDRLVNAIAASGYNMVRTHFLERFLTDEMTRLGDFNESTLDRFDYFIYRIKQEGIYLNLDLMTSWIGYTPGDIYSRENQDPLHAYKARIHFEPEIRDNWRIGVERLLGHTNKYTGTRLVDDPVLAMAVGYNEQEYGFWRDFDPTLILPRWQSFLKERYLTIESLRKAWGQRADAINSFEDVPMFTFSSKLPDSSDAALFLYTVETNTADWYERVMSELGYKGPVTSYNCGKNMYYNIVRKDMPAIAMNAYHAHPSNWIRSGSAISQKSSIEEKLKIMRDFVGVRLSGKPFVITEYALAFWNQYRYEQSFVVGAYAAFQGFDGLTTHGAPVSHRDSGRILAFGSSMDPIAKASEYLTFFLFRRGDVREAAPEVHIQISEEEVFKDGGLIGGVPTDVSLSALMARMDVQVVDQDLPLPQENPNALYVELNDTAPILVSDAGYAQTVDDSTQTAKHILSALRELGIIESGNVSNGESVFESSTGQMLVRTSENYMQIDAPRFQGICAEGGVRAKLSHLDVERMSERGVLALVSLDEMKPINEARRLIIVYATNALNSGMQFVDKDMTVLKHVGNSPPLLKRGAFRVAVENEHADTLKLYPLDFSGRRLKEISPSVVAEGSATFEVDTLRDGAAVFFEIQADDA